MVGERDWNLRQGDIAEQLGTLLLQGLAAVAPVPRTEDTGVDIVATLLRRDGARRLIADDAFYVQLKAVSVNTINYNHAEIDWLRSLELPFFIGSVDVKAGEIRLFAAHELYRIMADWNSHESISTLRMYLKDGSPRGHDEPGEYRLHLGPPILCWGLPHLSDQVFLRGAYEIVKEHVGHMQANIVSSVAGFHLRVDWHANEKPKAERPSQVSGGEPHRLYTLLNKTWRYLHAWYFQMRAFGLHAQAEQLYRLLLEMEKVGWVIPDGAMLLHAIRQFDDLQRTASFFQTERQNPSEISPSPDGS